MPKELLSTGEIESFGISRPSYPSTPQKNQRRTNFLCKINIEHYCILKAASYT